jgi:predicted negative regulator of RcsB-dependent stress response
MNESFFDELLVGNPLLGINTTFLIVLVFLALVSAWSIAWRWRNHYQTTKLVRDYVYYAIIHMAVGSVFLKLSIVLIIGTYLMGLVVLFFRSNNYFYK